MTYDGLGVLPLRICAFAPLREIYRTQRRKGRTD